MKSKLLLASAVPREAPFLRTMLEYLQAGSMTTTLDKEQRIFLDWSPKAFESILQYLRSGRWSIPFGSDPAFCQEINTECEYFQIEHRGPAAFFADADAAQEVQEFK